MSSAFNAPVGARADTFELEYVSALHQTTDAEDSDFINGSIDAEDVKTYLLSRHNIKVSKEYVRNVIFNGLAGGDGLDECLDITEVTAMLIIPYLLKCVQQERNNENWDEETPDSRLEDATQNGASSYNFNEDRKESQTAVLSASEVAPGMKVIQDVLNIILGDVFGSDKPERLTHQRIRQMFAEYGEVDLITDDTIIQEMIDMAEGDSPDTVFNAEAFARALTSDITLYDITKERSMSSHYEDVFGEKDVQSQRDHSNSGTLLQDVENNSQENELATTKVSLAYTYPNIDITASVYRSTIQVVFSLAIFVRVVEQYILTGDFGVDVCSDDNFGCTVAEKVLGYLYKLSQVMATGTVIIFVFNLGNNPKPGRIWETIACFGFITLYFCGVLISDFELGLIKGDKPINPDLLSFAVIIALVQLIKLLGYLMRGKRDQFGCFISKLLTFGDSYVKKECALKQAAVFKVNKLVNNALTMHKHGICSSSKAHFARKLATANDASTNALALLNYSNISEQYETFGGMIWCMKMWWNGSLNKQNGIILNTRVLVGTLILVVAVFLSCISVPIILADAIDWYDDEVLNGTFIPLVVLEEVFEFLPRKWMLQISAAFSVILSVLILMTITVVAIPSYIMTIMKFRTGSLPSLRDPLFKLYRDNIYNMAYVIGVMIWSPAVMVVIVFFAVFLGVLIVVWQETWPYVLNIIAVVLGIVITILIKMVIVSILKRINHAGFYRTRVLLHNIATIALECWHIGITVFSAITRMAKLVVVSFCFFGRIDRPFLANDITIDRYPLLFRQSLLITEAHRHPYIERMGTMYMMKLRHGKNFATQAGSTWRLLFVFALMPWLRKYRIPDAADYDEKEILELLGTTSSTNHVSKLEAEIASLKSELEKSTSYASMLEAEIRSLKIKEQSSE